MSYILSGAYGDMRTKVLGSSVSKIKKSLTNFFEDELAGPEDYDKSHIRKIKFLLKKEWKTPDDMMNYYNKNFDNDYYMQDSY